MERLRSIEPLAESNCYVLGEKGRCVVIDPNSPVVEGMMTQRGWQPDYFILTHEHCDHMAGLEKLRARWPKTPTVCTTLCSVGIQSPRLNMTSMMEVYLTFRGKQGVHYPPFVCREAEVTFSKPCTLFWQGHTLRCVPLPGHTPGSMGIFLDEITFFSGDYLLPGEDVILRLPGGSQRSYELETLPFLRTLPVGMEICPGHGAPYIRIREENTYGLEPAARS